MYFAHPWRLGAMYSIMLYMKTRVTFRVAPDLAEALRVLPNQTSFVEQALRDALRAECPVCGGTGRVAPRALSVSNFREAGLPRLKRDAALQLKGLVALARRTAATSLELERAADGRGLGFVVARGADVLLRGTLHGSRSRLDAS